MDASVAKGIKKTWYKYLTAKVFDNRFGHLLDNYLMNVTAKRWASKTRLKRKDNKGFLLGMHANKHYSKPNPDNFQKILLQRYENNLTEVFKRYELCRSAEWRKEN